MDPQSQIRLWVQEPMDPQLWLCLSSEMKGLLYQTELFFIFLNIIKTFKSDMNLLFIKMHLAPF